MSCVTAATLRQASRAPPQEFTIKLASGRQLVMLRLLRILPAKRLTGIARLDGKTVLAKLFIASSGGERHWERERQGVASLLAHDIPTPQLLGAGRLEAGGHYLLTEYISNTCQGAVPPAPTFTALGRLHAAGLVQEDAHFGNFLTTGEGVLVIDGDAIRPLSQRDEATRNLALLLAQLSPLEEAAQREHLLAAYRNGNPTASIDLPHLSIETARARQRRLDDYLKKCLRDCSLFKVEKRLDRFLSVVRDEADVLAPLLADPDRWMEAGTPLKRGNTATVALIELGRRKLVVKRYNLKGPAHALSRSWRPSRAWHSWLAGHRLAFLSIATPRPLALVEQRFGPLRGRAWLIVEHCSGDNLADHLAALTDGDAPLPEAEVAAVRTLFNQLAASRISHGDLKATNLLWNDNRLVLIDLDALRQHASAAAFTRAWHKDRARFLRNWAEGSPLRSAFETVVPGG